MGKKRRGVVETFHEGCQGVLSAFRPLADDDRCGKEGISIVVSTGFAGFRDGRFVCEFEVPAIAAREVPRIAQALGRLMMLLYGTQEGRAYWPPREPVSMIDIKRVGDECVVYDPREKAG